MRAILAFLTLLFMLPLTGCQHLQKIEQWKCDNLGLCHFARPHSSLVSSSLPSPMPEPLSLSGSLPPTTYSAYPDTSQAATTAPTVFANPKGAQPTNAFYPQAAGH